MPFVPRRPSLLAVPLLLATTCAVAVVSARGGPGTAIGARAAVASAAADLGRPAWFGMSLVRQPVQFVVAATRPAPPVLHVRSGILVDIDSNAVLWQLDPHAHLPPASTTKILTALVALANFNPDRKVTLTPQAVQLAWDETRMGLSAGQTLTVRELLIGMLLVSGNDAANGVALGTVGMERFVGAMNAQVDALGLHDSHFTSPVGLDDPQQYSSAYDLAAIGTAAVRTYPLFRDIVAMRTADLAAAPGHPEFFLQSINLLLAMYPPATGIKPGWTGDAGYCEVAMAVRDGHRLISVLLNAPYSYSQSRRLLDWGFVQEGLPSTLPTPTPSAAPSPHG
ncbi:MAG: D-alanyl-D-alanine carboxypeptidase [Candidatus Dormibacteraeota bacterium]|nr:D-alanyl-D-alanine carboxypeptidase [Candidatus Dormibacteraeota bacterium]